ncbi:A24 family peptidase [Evansella sp. AB-P1]|uniref:A24 family peptidase n=1 Tax=Evansella sp. AB-P1 TaxID=3037653 RepID=UPI00241C05A6|nr:A24 family peptidase [Evansella sp. AB-P1]MDG5788473.1 A24 family peptidase [Evansella sp. AB-P1]
MIIHFLLGVVLLISLVTDLMYRKIYNTITFPAMVFGFIYYIWTDGWNGFLFSGLGFLVGIGLLFIPFVLGGIGAGDVKLLAAIGALMGTSFVFYTFLYTCIAGGIIAIILIIKKKQGKGLYHRMMNAVTLKSVKIINDEDLHHAFPYGVAIFIGTFCAFYLGGV